MVINDDGRSDTDFRIEGNVTSRLFHVDTSHDYVTVNGAANDDSDLFAVLGNSDSNTTGANLLKVSPTEVVVNESSNAVHFRVESDSNTHALFVNGTGTEVVVNDTGQADTDFRIESLSSSKMLYVDTQNDIVEIRGPANDDTDIFCDSPPSRYFCLKTKNKREKYIKNLISFKKKWAPWNEPGAFFLIY